MSGCRRTCQLCCLRLSMPVSSILSWVPRHGVEALAHVCGAPALTRPQCQVLGGKTGESDDLALLRSVGARLGEPGGMQDFLDVLLGDSGRAVSTFELLNSKTMAKLVAYLTGGLVAAVQCMAACCFLPAWQLDIRMTLSLGLRSQVLDTAPSTTVDLARPTLQIRWRDRAADFTVTSSYPW